MAAPVHDANIVQPSIRDVIPNLDDTATWRGRHHGPDADARLVAHQRFVDGAEG